MASANHAEKMREKKDFYENNSIQSIKSELLNNNTTLSASSKVLFSGSEQNFSSIANSYEDDDYNNDNNDNNDIDVETDSDNDQQITELKQMSYHTLGEPTVKHEEWSRIVKSSMLKAKSVERLNATANDIHLDQQDEKIRPINETKIAAVEPILEKCSSHLKRALLPDDEESEFYTDTFTSSGLLNLSEKKRGRYGSGRGFSIENLIGRIVEDR